MMYFATLECRTLGFARRGDQAHRVLHQRRVDIAFAAFALQSDSSSVLATAATAAPAFRSRG